MKQEPIKTTGVVTEALGDTKFKVQLENSHVVLATLSGRIRRYFIKILPGDKVDLEMSPYDLSRARIIHREDNRPPKIHTSRKRKK